MASGDRILTEAFYVEKVCDFLFVCRESARRAGDYPAAWVIEDLMDRASKYRATLLERVGRDVVEERR